jgi:hypothetical protein
MEGTFSMNGLIRRVTLAAITAVAMTGAIAAPANAGILTASATDCGDESLSQPFAQFGDNSQYKLVQGGSFEGSLADYTLIGGAKVVSGNEPWNVGGSNHGKSLVLPAGSSVITPPACVGLAEPTLRFFAKKNSGLLSTLVVSVYVKTSLGLVVPVPVGVVLGNGQWKATPRMLIVANLLPLLPGDRTPVAFQFTPLLGSWQIDDVYVDPMRIR